MAADVMPTKLLRHIKPYYTSTKVNVKASGGDSLSFEIRPGVQQECSLSSTLFNYIIGWILSQVLHGYPGIKVEPTPKRPISPMPTKSRSTGRCKACSKLVGMRIYASKTKVMLALTAGDQRQAILLDCEPMEDVGLKIL